jgi:hypothetical protein
MTKQIRLKDRVLKIVSCYECPCMGARDIDGCTCNLRPCDVYVMNGIPSGCPLEDAE